MLTIERFDLAWILFSGAQGVTEADDQTSGKLILSLFSSKINEGISDRVNIGPEILTFRRVYYEKNYLRI